MKKNLHSFVLSVVLLISSFSIIADDITTAEEYVSKSLLTLENFSNDPNMGWFRENISGAKGILIIPAKLEVAFVLGGYGGTGVLLKHNNNDQWSYPAFYGAGAATFGLQRRVVVTMRGRVGWITVTQVSIGSTTIRTTEVLFVV